MPSAAARSCSFNPCCGGSGTEGIPSSAARKCSVCCFNPCCGGSGTEGPRRPRSAASCAGFNPCCGGSGTEGAVAKGSIQSAGCVSILVAADRGLKVRCRQRNAVCLRPVSILVAADRGLKVDQFGDTIGKITEFQSLLRRIGD